MAEAENMTTNVKRLLRKMRSISITSQIDNTAKVEKNSTARIRTVAVSLLIPFSIWWLFSRFSIPNEFGDGLIV
mgnify:CR=1 FL=1